MTEPTTRTLQELTVQLPGGRCLRIRLVRDQAGEPKELYLAEGWTSGGEDVHRRLGPLPGHTLPELRQALERLEASR